MGAEAGFAGLPVVPQQIQVESQAQNKRSCSGWEDTATWGEPRGTGNSLALGMGHFGVTLGALLAAQANATTESQTEVKTE